MSEPKVNIILATYNGEKHIEKQLDSILAQTYSNIALWIRDDGSTDHTVAVIQAYGKAHPEAELHLLEQDGRNLRCPASFYEILRRCDPADYYAFSDQDDIWYAEKIERAVRALQKEDDQQMLLYYSACDYKTEDGRRIRTSARQKENLQLSDVLYYTPGSGFTIVFNEKTRKELVLDVEPGPEYHDRWLIRGVVCFGKVIYDPKSTAAHIRHEEAVTAGDADNGSLLKNFVQAELFGPDAPKEKKALRYFAKQFSERLPQKEQRTLLLFTKKNTPLVWMKKVCYPHRLRARGLGEIALRLLFLLGRI